MAAQLPEVPFVAARRDELDVDAEALRHHAFLFMLLVASGLVYFVGNTDSSSFSAEDVFILFLFWNIFLVVFLASFVLHLLPAVARIAALVTEALRAYLFGNRALLLF